MIEVLIVDDQKTVCEILQSYVEADPGLKLVGCASNGKEAVSLTELYQPHIVLMDIEMPIMDGLAATKIISEQFINVKVLIISVHNDDNYLNMALQVGAKGYLKKNTPEKELINAIYSSYKGYFQLGPGLLEQYLHKAVESRSNFQEIEQLKSIILQQSQLLDNLSNGINKQAKSNNNNGNGQRIKHKLVLENRVDTLEEQFYCTSRCLDKLDKKVSYQQQLHGVAILCSFLGIAILLVMGV